MNMPEKPVAANAGLASRRAALHALARILGRRQMLDQAFAQTPGFAELPGPDRAFVMLLVKTVLRRKGQIDALLREFLTHPLDETPPPVVNLLRLGLAQLLWLATPPHAAVHSSVELARQEGLERHTGLVNALLKRAGLQGAEWLALQDAPRLSLPLWLWQSWRDAYGEEEARAAALASLQEAPLDITVKHDADTWAQRLGGAVVEQGTVRLQSGSGDITQLPGFDEGEWWVQDAASALPVRRLAEAMGGLSGKSVTDLCAAPGGKTAQLCALGATVTAVDISAARMQRVKENITRLNLTAECVVADALKYRPASPPDAILLDAPCSATGTIRRHPEILHLRQPADVARLAATQARLLRHALSMLAPGGVLAYSVCSLEQAEGEAQTETLRHEFPKLELLREERTLPHQRDTDGFYVAILRK